MSDGFVIREVRDGPADLRARLPVTARIVQMHTDAGGAEVFCATLDEPFKLRCDDGGHFPGPAEEDDRGAFVWVTDVVIRAHTPGEEPYFGMRGFVVDLACVTDSGPGGDEAVDLAGLDFAAVVAIDDAEDAADEPHELADVPAPSGLATAPMPSSAEATRRQASSAVPIGAAAPAGAVTAGAATGVQEEPAEAAPAADETAPQPISAANEPAAPAGAAAPAAGAATSAATGGATTAGDTTPPATPAEPVAGERTGPAAGALPAVAAAVGGPAGRAEAVSRSRRPSTSAGDRRYAVGAVPARWEPAVGPLAAAAPPARRRWKRELALVLSALGLVGIVALALWLSPALTPTGQPAGIDPDRLLRLLPAGYPAGTCQSAAVGDRATAVCGKNDDPGGPRSATYTLVADKSALDAEFRTVVADSTSAICPGDRPSPAPWHAAATPDKTAGRVLCVRGQDGPMIAWTDDAQLLVGVVQSGTGGPSLDQLYEWWSSHR